MKAFRRSDGRFHKKDVDNFMARINETDEEETEVRYETLQDVVRDNQNDEEG